ncbi:hypothetical protein DBR32_02740 [Taibaiella sp. KBW10]|uniref:DUF2480 family protein n=1 Tax=Taibaiella sp. KBW10 TaxID=2153357 RepID=UPI000F597CD5|nr:DUF2480 family protein [Taibaiella sp. KBW10]RQO32535.1 hypothetical protein DBR32_02740 [Taibaiella sp. KBW10]
MDTIVNKVAESGIVTLNLEQYLPKPEQIASLDIAPFLFKGMILREKDFRTSLLELDWTPFENKQVAVFCSADAIIPMWAYMLLATYLYKCGATPFYGTVAQLTEHLLLQAIDQIDISTYTDSRLVIKGCSDIQIPESAYFKVSQKVLPVVKSLMYGEPCSTVPIYKKK